jgi:drug/metabolite transporter (DMT)-like permease
VAAPGGSGSGDRRGGCHTGPVRRLLVLAFIWGWSFLFIKVAVEGMTPTTVAASRIALGALALHVVLRVQGVRLPTDRTTWRHLAVTAAFGSVVPFCLLAWGEERISSALTAVLNASTPLFTAVAGAVLLGERLRAGQRGGLVVGLVGVGLAAGVGGADLGASSLAGGGAAVAAGACYGVGFAYMKRHLMGIPPVVAACGQLTVGAVVLTPVALTTSAVEGIDLAPHRVGAVAILGLLGTGLAYVLSYRVVSELGPTTASLVTYLVPVVAVTVGVVVLGERFRLGILVGGALIVVGIALVHQRLRPWSRRPRLPAGAAVNLGPGPGGR